MVSVELGYEGDFGCPDHYAGFIYENSGPLEGGNAQVYY
jgi:hypothetical protein